MTEVLLKELSNSDIDWINANGHQWELAPGTVLLEQGKAVDSIHILLDGTLAVLIPQVENNHLSSAFAAIEGNKTLGKEITRLFSGEVVGETSFVGSRPNITTVKAVEKSIVLSISQQRLATKLQQDISFAARFYRVLAILFLDRMHSIVNKLSRSNQAQGQPLRDVLCVLGELNDSDIDWMMATGIPQKITANSVLIREGGPVDALYILLSGIMSVSISEDQQNPLTRAFAAIEGNDTPEREIARLFKGEIVGETSFIDTRLPSATIKALEDSLVLSIPRQQLAAKLQQDIGFASRFYKVIATLISDRLQAMLSKFGYGRRVYSQGQPLNEKIQYEDELDLTILDRMAIAGSRFDWMLGQLKSTLS